MPLEIAIVGILIFSLTFYVLMGGADYGAGVWDMFCFGQRAQKQRALIAAVVGPIWEANHVWLILVIVVLFTAFPRAFALVTTDLHIPLVVMLVGIVLRGSAFTFRTYDTQDDSAQRRWSLIFEIASLVTPVTLGIAVGAISAGKMHPMAKPDFIYSWVHPFAFANGLFALAIFAFLAATYLTNETPDKELQDDFRLRALVSQGCVGVLALAVFFLAHHGAHQLWEDMAHAPWTIALHVMTATVSVGAIASLILRRYWLARICAAGQAALILWGWALAQYPYLVRPELTIFNCAAPKVTLQLLLWALLAGALLLFPSFYLLLKIFSNPTGDAESAH
jgi:cytochrome d ubiquinol oxidase subunit II